MYEKYFVIHIAGDFLQLHAVYRDELLKIPLIIPACAQSDTLLHYRSY
jgi:hypothetical protein